MTADVLFLSICLQIFPASPQVRLSVKFWPGCDVFTVARVLLYVHIANHFAHDIMYAESSLSLQFPTHAACLDLSHTTAKFFIHVRRDAF